MLNSPMASLLQSTLTDIFLTSLSIISYSLLFNPAPTYKVVTPHCDSLAILIFFLSNNTVPHVSFPAVTNSYISITLTYAELILIKIH